MPDGNDEALLRAFLAGDREAGDALARRHAAAMREALRRRLAAERGFGPEDVENVFQQAWLGLIEDGGRRLRVWDPRRPLAPFLIGVALNACRDYLKRERLRRAPSEPLLSWAGAVEEAGPLESAEAREALARALQALAPRERMILEWTVLQALSHRQVATMLGVSGRSVATLVLRARRRLGELLKKGKILS